MKKLFLFLAAMICAASMSLTVKADVLTFDFEGTNPTIPEEWVNDETYPWTVVNNAPAGFGGTYCIACGNSGINSSSSTLQATFTFAEDGSISFDAGCWGEGSTSFWDKCALYMDDELRFSAGASQGWQNVSIEVSAGTHTFRWEYTKDGSVHPTVDAFFLDNIVVNLGSLPPTVEEDGWVHYDNGEFESALGLSSEDAFSWGIKIPAGTVADEYLTKVSLYINVAANATVYIYQGGPTPNEATLLHTQDVTFTQTGVIEIINLNPSVEIDPTQDIWIVFNSPGHAASYSVLENAVNGRWIENGGVWDDIAVVTDGYYENIAWMIRGLFEFGPYASNAQATTVTATSAKITWSGNAEAYDLLFYVWNADQGVYVRQRIETNVEALEYTLTGLSPETNYAVEVVPSGFVTPTGDVTIPTNHYSEFTFTTLSPCEVKPVVEASEIEEKSAKISWRGFVDNYNLRYKKVTFFCDFENGIDGWTTMDADGDGYNWFWSGNDHCGYGSTPPFSGQYTVISESYDNAIYEKLTPDNYLITPQIEFGDTLSFWHRASNPAYPDDTVAVLVATKDNPAVEDFTAIAEFHTNGNTDYTQEVIPLEGYSGLGHIAFRHYNSYDHYRVEIDDVMVSDAEWTEMSNVTSPTVLNDLMPNTMYVVQVQIICDSEPGKWSETLTFTTLEEGTGIEQIVDSRESKVDSRKILHEGNLYILRDGKIFNAQGARVK